MSDQVYVLLPSSSQYGVIHHFTRSLYEALQRHGLSCQLLAGEDRYLRCVTAPPAFSICFNGAATYEDNIFLCDVLKVPHVSCLIDPFFRFYELMNSSHIILTCDDRFSCMLLHMLGFSQALFMPHAVERELGMMAEDNEKIYEVSMLATFIDYERKRKAWHHRFTPEICRAMENAIEISLSDPKTSFMLALLDELLPNWKRELLKEQAHKSYLYSLFQQGVFSEVEMYLKGRDRMELLKSIRDHEIHVFGSTVSPTGWKKHLKNASNIVVHKGVSYEKAIQIMRKSKILLNSCIKNAYGAHERAFYGMACGAVVVTNDNAYMQEQFRHGEEILLFHRTKFAQMNDEITALLEDEKKRRLVAEQGKQKTLAYHTWDNRVQNLLKEIQPLIRNRL